MQRIVAGRFNGRRRRRRYNQGVPPHAIARDRLRGAAGVVVAAGRDRAIDVATRAATPAPGPPASPPCPASPSAISHLPERPTGCTVILAANGAVGGVDVRGGAPGTAETDLLSPQNTVERVNAIVLSGGSAFGLAARDGVMKFLSEKKVGYPTRRRSGADRAGRDSVRLDGRRTTRTIRAGRRLRLPGRGGGEAGRRLTKATSAPARARRSAR